MTAGWTSADLSDPEQTAQELKEKETHKVSKKEFKCVRAFNSRAALKR